MAENTGIEWATHTFNPWRGCTKVSEGCKHCYADTLSKRNPGALGIWGPKGTRAIAAEPYWRLPLKWNAEAGARYDRIGDSLYATNDMIREQAQRPRVFCASLADVFEGTDTMPASAHEAVAQARQRLFELIAVTPHLDWLLLTKRPQNVMSMVPECALIRSGPLDPAPRLLPNIWVGTSCEDQKTANERIPHLLKVPAICRFLSCEPMIGALDISGHLYSRGDCETCHGDGSVFVYNDDATATSGTITGGRACPTCGFDRALWQGPSLIDWVICGGESGGEARPMHPDWVRILRDDCVAAKVPFLFKQWGEYRPPTEGETFNTGPGKAQKVPAYIMTIDGIVNCYKHDSHVSPEVVLRVGKKAAGRILDGRTWDEFPVPVWHP